MTARNTPAISGTKEWAARSVNCCTGCSHGCLYCYARARAARFGLRAAADWTREDIRPAAVAKGYRFAEGTTMFPTTHDITPTNLAACLTVLGKLLGSGRRVLIVSKPHRRCIGRICAELALFRQQVLLRFTIGAVSDRLLRFWEPGAPPFAERLECLRTAREAGFATSVSAEPLLEAGRAAELVERVGPHVTHSIWIGKANRLRERAAWALPADHPEVLAVEAGQTDAAVRGVAAQLRDDPLIRWKESYKQVLGLALATEPGLDI